MQQRCLYCYQILADNEIDFHATCSKKMFGVPVPPILNYSEKAMEALATQIVQAQVAVTGVQPKLSLHLTPGNKPHTAKHFTIVGMWGEYILKPPTPHYTQLPEVEDLTMHLAEIAKIKVVPHSLIRMSSGNLAYVTKRVDRHRKNKIHMEDMCQLTERLTEDKYKGSHEQIAKSILKYSANPGLDVINFFELVLFSFLTGNADMHLKNFSLLHQSSVGAILSPAYDLVSTVLVNPTDTEDLALTLNGKKKKINRNDFIAAFSAFNLDTKQQENIFKKMAISKQKWLNFIDVSFLSKEMKDGYKMVVEERFGRVMGG